MKVKWLRYAGTWIRFTGTPHNPAQTRDRDFFVELRGYRFGFQKSPLWVGGAPYMTRYIMYCGLFCIRLHHFFTGDDDRAPHDHPFWFWTFPFASYFEKVGDIGEQYIRRVRRFRWHYRPATFKHIVIFREAGYKPFWTLVVAGRPTRTWGFWPSKHLFVSWRVWK